MRARIITITAGQIVSFADRPTDRYQLLFVRRKQFSRRREKLRREEYFIAAASVAGRVRRESIGHLQQYHSSTTEMCLP